jgi:PAS domain S-box
MIDAEEQEQTSRLEGERSRLEENVLEHVRREKALETERDFCAAVLESADASILVLDSAGRVLQVNRAVELATGYPMTICTVASSSPPSRSAKPPRR